MQPEELASARAKLAEARRLMREGRTADARQMLEQIADLDAELDGKELVEKSHELLKRIETDRRLRFSRWALVATTLISAAIVAVLTFLPVKSTLIELKLHVSRADFELGKPVDLGPLSLRVADLSGGVVLNTRLTAAQVGTAVKNGEVTAWRQLDAVGQATLLGNDAFWSAAVRSAYLKLANLSVAGDSRVAFETVETDSQQIKLILAEGSASGSLDVSNPIQVSCYECKLTSGDSAWEIGGQALHLTSSNKEAKLTSETGPFTLALTPTRRDEPSGEITLARHLPIKSLKLTRLVGKDPRSSIVLPSRVSLIELAGKEIVIPPGDFLILGELSDFQIKSITFDRQLTVNAVGTVARLATKKGASTRNLVPSCIEWILANHALNLFLAALLPLLSVVLAVLYRLKILDEG